MSVARLSALVSRAAAPPGRVGQEAALPAFDAPAAIGTAMLQVGLATMVPAAQARRDAASIPRVAPPPPREPSVAVELTARPDMPEAVPRGAVAAPAPAQPLPNAPSFVTPPDAAPPPHPRESPRRAGIDAAVPMATPVGIASSLAPPVTAGALPVAARPIAEPASVPADETRETSPPSPPHQITIAEKLPPVRTPGAAPALAAAAMPEPAAPAITIGTVEVVIAPPPRQAAPAPSPRPAPDRGFSRYAAIRSGRDRAW